MRKLLTFLAVVIAMIAVVPLSVTNSVTPNTYTTSLSDSNDNGNFITTIATSTSDFIGNFSISLTPAPAYAWMPPSDCLEALGGCWSCWTMCIWELLNVDFFDWASGGHNW